jgi:hypothetical protein
LRFLVVTACDENYSDLQKVTSPTIKSYCEKQGYDCFINRITEKERPPAWYKIKEVLKAFETGADYVLWIDTDAIIVNQEYKLQDIVEVGKDFYFSCNWAAMNNGVFMMKNNQFNKYFLDLTWNQTHFIYDSWWEQRAMIHLLETGCYPEKNIKEMPCHIFNSEEYYRGCFVHHITQAAKHERIKSFKKILAKQFP